MWKFHELSKTIISNKKFQFVFLIWQSFCEILDIKTKLSTTFYFEINDQSEIFNQKMKQYLRAYVNYQQNDWSKWFSMIEYVFNTSNSISIKLSLFFINYEFESKINFEFIKINDTTRKKILKRKTTNIYIDMKKIWLFAKKHFDQTQTN